ncbi:MAG: hypothetical protein AAGI51_05200 [Pseudomonadota bacterium]
MDAQMLEQEVSTAAERVFAALPGATRAALAGLRGRARDGVRDCRAEVAAVAAEIDALCPDLHAVEMERDADGAERWRPQVLAGSGRMIRDEILGARLAGWLREAGTDAAQGRAHGAAHGAAIAA